MQEAESKWNVNSSRMKYAYTQYKCEAYIGGLFAVPLSDPIPYTLLNDHWTRNKLIRGLVVRGDTGNITAARYVATAWQQRPAPGRMLSHAQKVPKKRSILSHVRITPMILRMEHYQTLNYWYIIYNHHRIVFSRCRKWNDQIYDSWFVKILRINYL